MKRILSFLMVVCVLCGMLLQIPIQAKAYPDTYPLPTLTGDMAQDTANIATSQLGYAYNDGTAYGAWWTTMNKWGTDFTRLDWCGMFACWCAYQAGAGMGVAFDSSGARASALFEWQKKNVGSCTDFSIDPQPGDFMFFGGSDRIPNHVAIVTSYNSETKTVYMVGGNQGNSPGVVTSTTCPWYPGAMRGSKYVLGFGRPNYVPSATASPGKAVLKVFTDNTDKKETVFTWISSSNTTHYNLLLEQKNATGAWKEYERIQDVRSGVTRTLPMGNYRGQLQSCNANAPTEDGTGIRTTLSDYVEFTVGCGHAYMADVTKEATCGEDGSCTYTCMICGHSYTQTIPATREHNYGEGVYYPESDTQPEKTAYTCNACGFVLERFGGLKNGSCGQKVSWSLDETGRLIIYGTGPMADYTLSNYSESTSPFFGMEDVKSVVIKKGVTAVGDYAFFRRTSLGSVTVSASVTRIGESAFDGCTELGSVELSNGLLSLEAHAFNCCDSLTALTIPDSVTEIGEYAFIRCRSLRTVVIGAGVTTLNSYTFSGCSSLESVTIHFSLKEIQTGAFSGCGELRDVYYKGVQQQWEATQIAGENESLKNARIHYQDPPQGWLQAGDNWYYFNKGKMVTGWLEYGPVWYYFKPDGTMLKGWLYYGKKWYYFNDIGRMHTGWAKDGGQWYYMDQNGHMVTGWLKLGGVWYYLKPSGNMAIGWVKEGNTWYYFKPSGAMQTGWLQYGKIWYYFHSSGAMATGTVKIGSKTYDFGTDGICKNP